MSKINCKKIFLLIPLIFIIILCSCSKNNTFYENNLEMHFIDVGQGDAILIHVENKTLLIDCGPKEAAGSIINYLDSYNIKNINYLIATHPHDDHIGNMATIIKKYNIQKFYSPKVESNGKIYENMIDALKYKNLKINILKASTTPIKIGTHTNITVLSPKEGYSDKNNLNNMSAVLLIKYKNVSFLLTGDAEEEAEKSILSNYSNIKADVLKIGHHGSDSSTSENFLKAVSPSISVISVGKDNSYGHPHERTLKLLKKYKIKTYRTDNLGTVKIISDGDNIKIMKTR